MIAVVVTNLLYLGVALAVAVVVALVVVVRQRKPKSVEANVSSFHKGLRALAPDDEAGRSPTRSSWGGAHKPVLVRRAPMPAAEQKAEGPGVDETEHDDDEDEPDAAAPAPDGDPLVDLASRQRRDTTDTAPTEAPATSEETGTG